MWATSWDLPCGVVLCWKSGLYCESSGLKRGFSSGTWCPVLPCRAANWWAKFEFANRFGNKCWKFAAAAAWRFRWCTAAECKEGFEKAEGFSGGLYGDFEGLFELEAINAETEKGFGVSFGVSGRPESDSDFPQSGESTRLTTSELDVPESADSRLSFSVKSVPTASRRTCFEGSSRWHTRLKFFVLVFITESNL